MRKLLGNLAQETSRLVMTVCVSEYISNRALACVKNHQDNRVQRFPPSYKSSISGVSERLMSQSKISGVNESKPFGKPETTAIRRYAQLEYFGVGSMFDF